MRYLSLIFLSFMLTACASLDTDNNASEAGASVFVNTPKKIEYSGTAFARYLKDYVAKNINPRSRTSRGLIDRSGIESNGRLPSKSLYQSLGYRIRDAFVALPPELSTRGISNPEAVLLAQLIQDSEITWALLDTTKERLQSKGGLEEGRQDWEVAVTRRNLLSEAVAYWYQLRNQELYDQGITRLDSTTNQKFDEISQARENYDVEDLRDKELALLGMRSDIALVFQFYSSEQARLFNRIDTRALPKGAKKKLDLNKVMSCTIDSQIKNQGITFLEANYPTELKKIRNNTNQKAAAYELNQLARKISSKALKAHAEQLKVIENEFLSRKEMAERNRELDIQLLTEKQAHLIKQGQEVNPEEIELLKSSPLTVERKPLIRSRESQAYYNALSVLSSWNADVLVELNQKRLSTVLAEINTMYEQYQKPIWQGVSRDVGIIRELLYEVYDYTLIDYLIGYERAAFSNKAMLHNCQLSSELHARNIKIDHKVIDQFAALVEKHTFSEFPRSAIKTKFDNFKSLEGGLTAKNLGDGYKGRPVVIAKSSVAEESQVDEALESARVTLSRNGYPLVTQEEGILNFVGKKEGYSVEVGAYSDAESVLKMVKRFKRSVPKLVYLSKKYREDKSIIIKVLVGREKKLDSAVELQERIEFGDIRSFSDIKNDI